MKHCLKLLLFQIVLSPMYFMVSCAPGPFSITSATPGDRQVTLAWTESQGSNPTKESHVRYYIIVDPTLRQGIEPVSTSPYTVTGLTNGTTYWFDVWAEEDGNETAASSRVSATPHGCSTCRIFVTATTTQGNFGNAANADAICAADANKPTTGTYKAMITYSNGTRRACSTASCSGGIGEQVDWVLYPNTTYVRSDGTTTIGTTTSLGLLSSSLSNAFTANNTKFFWLGLNTVGGSDTDWTTQAGTDCTNWTYNGASPPNGQTGHSTELATPQPCTSNLSLLCVEQ